MNIAIHNLHKLPQFGDGRGNINGYVIQLIKRGYVRYLFFDDYHYRNSYKQPIDNVLIELFKHANIEDIGLDKVEIIFSSKKLNIKCDILLNFNVTRPEEFTPAVQKFKGLKIFHLMDYFWIEPASKKNERLIKYGIDYLFSYSRSDQYCQFFQHSFPTFIGKVIPVPFGFAPRFVNIKPFDDRIKKCVAMGSVNRLSRPDAPIPNWIEKATFYADEIWMHKFRRLLVLNKKELADVMDSMLPEFPKPADYKYDMVSKINEYQMFVSCESIFYFPPAKTWEAPAAGCVLVCSNHPCFTDFGFIDGVNCIKHNEFDIQDFKNKVTYFLNNQEKLKEIQIAGTSFVRDNYSHEAIADRLFLILKDIYAGRVVKEQEAPLFENNSTFSNIDFSSIWFKLYTRPQITPISYRPENVFFIKNLVFVIQIISPIIRFYEIIISPSQIIGVFKRKIGKLSSKIRQIVKVD